MYKVATFQSWNDLVTSLSQEPTLNATLIQLYFGLFSIVMNFLVFNVFLAVIIEIVNDNSMQVPENVSSSFFLRVIESCFESLFVLLMRKEIRSQVSRAQLAVSMKFLLVIIAIVTVVAEFHIKLFIELPYRLYQRIAKKGTVPVISDVSDEPTPVETPSSVADIVSSIFDTDKYYVTDDIKPNSEDNVLAALQEISERLTRIEKKIEYNDN
jgi:hypothetical protein